MTGHILAESWNVRYGLGITADTVTSVSVCISNKYSILENVCDLCNCVRSVCPHTSSEEDCSSSEIKNCHNNNIGNECLNLHKILGKQKQNCKIKVRSENSESITYRTI